MLRRPLSLTSLLLAALLLLAPRAAQAQVQPPSSVRLEFEGAGQATQTRASSFELVPRRRYAQYLGASAAQPLYPDQPRGPRVAFRARLRLETDLGLDSTLRGRLGYDPTTTFLSNTLELMSLQVWGLLGGLDLELGRQVQWGPTGFVHLDGATLAFHTREGLVARAFGGVEVTPGASTLNDTAFVVGTVGRDNIAWSEAAAVAGAELGWVGDRASLRLGARTSWLLAPDTRALPDDLPAPSTLIREQKLGAALYAAPLDRLELTADARYDLGLQLLDRANLELLSPTPLEQLRVGVGAERTVPTFQLDSIFNVFGALPSARWRALARWADLTALGHLQADASALWSATREDPDDLAFPGLGPDEGESLGGELGLTWRMTRVERRWLPQADAWLRGHLEDGWIGQQAWVALGGRAELIHQTLVLWTDHRLITVDRPLRPESAGTTWASALGVAWTTRAWGRFEASGELGSGPALTRAVALFGRYRLTFDVFE